MLLTFVSVLPCAGLGKGAGRYVDVKKLSQDQVSSKLRERAVNPTGIRKDDEAKLEKAMDKEAHRTWAKNTAEQASLSTALFSPAHLNVPLRPSLPCVNRSRVQIDRAG